MNFQEIHRTTLDERVLGCTFGHYPWDGWERKAQAAGVPVELAVLGRAVMREAYQHDWAERLEFCGWHDHGNAMHPAGAPLSRRGAGTLAAVAGTPTATGAQRDPQSGHEWKS